MKRFDHDVGYNLTPEQLSVLGKTGWELVAVIFEPGGRIDYGNMSTVLAPRTAFYFKKELST